MQLNFGEYKLEWPAGLHPTPGSLAVCQALCLQYFGEAGLTGVEDKENPTPVEQSKAQIAIKKVLDDKHFLDIVDEVFDMSKATVVGDEKYENRNKVKLSEVLNAPIVEGSGINIKQLILIRAEIVNFLSVG